MLFGVHPYLPVDALLGHESVRDDGPDWLAVHQERLQEAHSKARELAERKAAERVAQQQEKVYCPPVNVGQWVYLRHWPRGRNKIQDAWTADVYKVVDVQGATYAVEPLEGGPVKRVHRSNLRPCEGPAQVPRRPRDAATNESPVSLESEAEYTDPEYLLMEEVRCPSPEQVAMVDPESCDMESGTCLENDLETGVESQDVPVQEMSDLPDDEQEEEPSPCQDPPTESVSIPAADEPEMLSVPTLRKRKEGIAPLRRSQRTTAGRNKNPFKLPKPACNTVSLSTDVLSQVLAGVVLYTSKLKGMVDE